MTDDDGLERALAALRPKLHRYCARMTGSAVDGEDVVQETFIKAMNARAVLPAIANVEGWLFRIAHNASLDHLRARARSKAVPLSEDMDLAVEDADPDAASFSFRAFLELPALQRCAVILKDVLGHSVEEIAEIADCGPAAAKSALQRGRARLRTLTADDGDTLRLPLLSEAEREQMQGYLAAFRAGDFDVIRRMLADDVRLDLANLRTLEGKDGVSPYFTRYAEVEHWRFFLGAADGRPALLAYDIRGPMERPAHFVLVSWRAGEIVRIRDYLFAPYVMEACDWVRLD